MARSKKWGPVLIGPDPSECGVGHREAHRMPGAQVAVVEDAALQAAMSHLAEALTDRWPTLRP